MSDHAINRSTTREAHGLGLDPIDAREHLLRPVMIRAEAEPDRPIAAVRWGEGFVDVDARAFYERVRALAKGLLAAGVADGDRVVLMSRSRLEWLLVDYAILAVGGVTVPVYETSSADQLQWIGSNSGAVLAVVEDEAMADTMASIAVGVPTCRQWFVIEREGLDDLVQRGTEVDEAELDARIDALGADRLATIVYTSGTTGRPKGCALTHRNLCTNVLQSIDALRPMLGPDEVTLLFLPLAHVLTKIMALTGMEWGVQLAFSSGMDNLVEEMAIVHPTMLVAVPRVFEKVFNAAQHKAHSEGHSGIFHQAADVAIAWSESRSAGHLRPIVSAEHALFWPLVYQKLLAAFGGHLRFAFSGGGPLGARLTHFFNGIGIKVFEGYGLTETSPTLTVNRAEAWKPGTVGQPVAGTAIRIADDGEILAQGPQVFSGYWQDEEATAATFEDGWFLTGDIGELDAEGFLTVTGRKKELIVTAAGKNVAPAPLEDRLRAHPLISQAVVVGDARPFVAAMVTLDEDAAREWAVEHGKDGLTTVDLADDSEVRAEVQAAIDDANRSVSRAESIRKFTILGADLTIEQGELTPTLKVRRSAVEKSYADVIAELYA